jgi:hypothetical protein
VSIYGRTSTATTYHRVQYSLNNGTTWSNAGNYFVTNTGCPSLGSISVPAGSSIIFQMIDYPSTGNLYKFGMGTTTSCPGASTLCESSAYTVTGNITRSFYADTAQYSC